MSRRNWFGSLSARPHRSAPCDRQTRLIFEPLGLLALNLKEEKMQIKLMAFLTFAMGALPTMRHTRYLVPALLTLVTACSTPRDPYQHYPNIPGEVLIDNDHVVVQRFIVEPGAWEGIHSHPGKQIYIHVRGGEWTVRGGGKETVGTSADGSVGWMDAVDLSEQHESGNTTIELIWVTLK